MKKILLIDPYAEQKGVNVGLAYLSAALTRAGIEHCVADMVNGAPDLDERRLMAIASEYQNDAIGISVKTSTYQFSSDLAKKLKNAFPETAIIAGGPHATLYGESLLNEIPEFDAVISGEAETALPDLMKAWNNPKDVPEIGGVIIRTADGVKSIPFVFPSNLDELPFPDFDKFIGLKLNEHHYPLVTSRGCPHGCVYCSVGIVSGRKWRARSPENVIAELERAHDKWGVIEFDVLDDTFTQDVDRANEICRLLIERRLDFQWSCPNGIRADRVTVGLLDNMAKAGCHTIIFGVEAGDPELFASLHKGEKLADVENAVGMAKLAGLRVGGYFIIGLPGDTYDGTMRSLDYARRIGLDWAHFNILTPYPRTKVWDAVEKQGRFIHDWKTTRHFGAAPRPCFELNDYSADDMIAAYFAAHVRQKLYHLVLPPNLDAKRQRREIRKLRIKYDLPGWKQDVATDLKRLAAIPRILAKIAARKAAVKFRKPEARSVSQPKLNPEKLRVLFVNDHGGAAGGAEKYVIDLTRELSARGVETAWAFDKSGDWSGIDAKRYFVPGLWSAAPTEVIRRELQNAIRDFKPDIIHINNVQNYKVMDLCAEAAPTIRTVQDHNMTCPSMNRMKSSKVICDSPAGLACLERLLDGGCAVVGRQSLMINRLKTVLDGLRSLDKLSRVLTASRFMTNELISNGINPSRVESLPFFVEFPETFSPPDDQSPLRILWVGRLVAPDKGPDVFADVLASVRSPFEAVIAGDGPAKELTRRKIMELGLSSKVKFAGMLNRAQLDAEYERCHLVVFTSVWAEPFGYVGIEAAAHARPVVAFKVGGAPEWLSDGEGGYLVAPSNAVEMAARIDRFAQDLNLRKQMGLRHRESVMAIEKCNKAKHIDRLLQIYSEVAGR